MILNEQEPLEILTLAQTPEENQLEFHPTNFDDYLGQEELKKKLSLYTTAARMRNEPLDHLLLFGPSRPWQNNPCSHYGAGHE